MPLKNQSSQTDLSFKRISEKTFFIWRKLRNAVADKVTRTLMAEALKLALQYEGDVGLPEKQELNERKHKLRAVEV